MAKQHHTWFIWPRDSHTNEVIARMRQGGDNRFEEDTLTGVECSDGFRRDLWRIASFDDAYFLWRSRTDLRFRVFSQRGSGKPRDVTGPLFKKERRSPKNQKTA